MSDDFVMIQDIVLIVSTLAIFVAFADLVRLAFRRSVEFWVRRGGHRSRIQIGEIRRLKPSEINSLELALKR